MSMLDASFVLLFITALVTVILFTPVASKIAWHFGAVDYPNRRRINVKPTPRMGGIAVMFGIMTAFLVREIATRFFGWGPIVVTSPKLTVNYLGVGLSIVGMFLVGAIDDVKQIMPSTKFFWQIVAASVAAASGLVVGDVVNPVTVSLIDLGFITYPVTVFYLVAFANVINLIDGIDGLASGLSAIAGTTLFVVSVMAGREDAAALAITIVGAALGFLRWNFNPAKIFLGDSGSLLFGYCLGVTSLMGVTRVAGLTTLIVPIVIAGVPILDTFSAIVRRTRAGVSIGQADKGHIHHRLLRSGLSQRQAVLVMYAWTTLLCIGSFVITQVGAVARIFIFLALLTVSFVYAVHLNLFEPVIRRRFDPETGFNEVVPIDEVAEEEDLTRQEIDEVILGGLGLEGEHEEAIAKTDHPLHILAVSQHYWPEPFNFPDICEGLVARGHHVTVLTGTPNYPEGEIYPGYEHGAKATQERNGVHIRRSKLIPRGHDPIHRVLNYYSFSANASRIAREMGPGYDVVLSFQTSPVMMSNPALTYGRRHGVPVLLYCIDIWPECLTVGGIKRGSLVYRHYGRVSRDIYSAADRLAVTSPMFVDYLGRQLDVDASDAVYLPQYAEDIFNDETERREEYDPSRLNLTFAGNVGTAQAVNTLVEAGHYLADDDRFAIHIVGSGSELETLKKYQKEIGADCVTFHGRFPLSDMPAFYVSSDAMVATFQDSPILGYTLPRKIQSYMAAGRPIIGTVVGEARRVIEEAGCGLCCDAEDPKGLAEICRQFADMPREEREAMGARGRAYYEEHYSRNQFFETLEGALVALTEGDSNDRA